MSGRKDPIELGTLDTNDPTTYAWLFGESMLYPWQQNIMIDTWNGKQVAAVVANGAGKTTRCIALLGLAWMAKYPGSQVISTAGSWNQIETQLWPSLRARLAHHPAWTWNKREIVGPPMVVDGVTLQSTWNPFSTDDPKRAEGYHDDLIYGKTKQPIPIKKLYIIDEAKGVDDGIFDSMARCKVSGKLVASSPGEDKGAFYECFNRNAELWKTYVVPYTMCPHLMKGDEKRRIEKEIAIKGKNHPLIKSQYFAEFFHGTGYRVCDPDKLALAMSGLVQKRGFDRCLGFDWSAGRDRQVMVVREGNAVIEIKEFHEIDSVKLAHQLVQEFKRFNLQANEIVVDAGGGGKPFIHLLGNLGYQGILQYNNAAAPGDKIAYANKYAEDAFEHVANTLDHIVLPDNTVLKRQMLEREYVLPNNDMNRRRLEPKEELRRHGRESPDYFDALIMCFSTARHFSQMKIDRYRSGTFATPHPDHPEEWSNEQSESAFGGGWNSDVRPSTTDS